MSLRLTKRIACRCLLVRERLSAWDILQETWLGLGMITALAALGGVSEAGWDGKWSSGIGNGLI